MIRATGVAVAGHWHASAVDCVVLDFDERHRRRVAMTGIKGLAFLLDLPEAVMLRGGDAVILEDGGFVEIVAAPEPLIEVRGRTPADLVRLAWHIGNRHLPAQVMSKGDPPAPRPCHRGHAARLARDAGRDRGALRSRGRRLCDGACHSA